MDNAAQSSWLLYGAYGYTGRRIAEEAVRRGMRPVLAARDAAKLAPLGAELGCPVRAFPLDSVERVAAELAGMQAVLHCAGPFSATAAPMIEACLKARVHYLDITGEIEVIEAAAALHQRAVEAGVTLLPAVGFDVVPSDCLVAGLAQRLPGAAQLRLAFTFAGSMSPGTLKTVLEGLPRGGRVRQDGRIVAVPLAWKTMRVPFGDGTRWVMTVPWGDVASAWYSTGIPNIETYLAMPPGKIRAVQWIRSLLPAMRFGPLKGLAQWWVQRFIAGPTRQQEQSASASFWAQVRDDRGNHAEATLRTPGGYALTVSAALAALQRVLAGECPAGFLTPSQAFGPEFVYGLPGVE